MSARPLDSYYTPDALVQTLLDSALDPVLDRIEAESEQTSDDAAAGLLTVTVIDPACGSGISCSPQPVASLLVSPDCAQMACPHRTTTGVLSAM